jgi:hypothetical protein
MGSWLPNNTIPSCVYDFCLYIGSSKRFMSNWVTGLIDALYPDRQIIELQVTFCSLTLFVIAHLFARYFASVIACPTQTSDIRILGKIAVWQTGYVRVPCFRAQGHLLSHVFLCSGSSMRGRVWKNSLRMYKFRFFFGFPQQNGLIF